METQSLVPVDERGAASRPSCSKPLSAWLNEAPSLVVGTTSTPRWMPPSKPPAAIEAEALTACVAFEAYLAPGPAPAIAGAIAVTLRMVAFDPDFDESGVDAAAAATWVADLADLPAWAVAEACAQWRRLNEKRPTPAGIRTLALRETSNDRELLRRLRLTCAIARAEVAA